MGSKLHVAPTIVLTFTFLVVTLTVAKTKVEDEILHELETLLEPEPRYGRSVPFNLGVGRPTNTTVPGVTAPPCTSQQCCMAVCPTGIGCAAAGATMPCVGNTGPLAAMSICKVAAPAATVCSGGCATMSPTLAMACAMVLPTVTCPPTSCPYI